MVLSKGLLRKKSDTLDLGSVMIPEGNISGAEIFTIWHIIKRCQIRLPLTARLCLKRLKKCQELCLGPGFRISALMWVKSEC